MMWFEIIKKEDSMEKCSINPKSIIKPFADYSHGLWVSGHSTQLLISGQLGISKDGVIPKSIEGQAEFCFSNIEAILSEGGMKKSDVVKIKTYVTKRKFFQPYMKIRDRWIKDLKVPPASTLFVVSGFARPEFKIEIEALAMK